MPIHVRQVDEQVPVRPAVACLRLELEHPEPRLHAKQPHEPSDEAALGDDPVSRLGRREALAINRQRPRSLSTSTRLLPSMSAT